MSFIYATIIGFFAGIMASMGLGGGFILIVYLTLYSNINQATAQGINLVFFIPIAIIALIFHTKNHLIIYKKIVPSILCGTIGVFIGTYITTIISSKALSKIFAIFMIIIGLREFLSSNRKKNSSCCDDKQDSCQE